MTATDDKVLPAVRAWIGLGGNVGDVKHTLCAAINLLRSSDFISGLKVSSFYRTEPIDAQGEDYINAVACFDTTLKPLPLLRFLQGVELKFGRERPYWHAPRTLDLDLLLYSDLILNEPDLILPHPALHERAFVLVPMAELDKHIVIPCHGEIGELISTVQGQKIQRLSCC